MSIFDAHHTFTVFDRYFVSNAAWGFFELKQLQLDYYPKNFKKIAFEEVFVSLKTYNMLDTSVTLKGQVGNHLTKKIKFSDYTQIQKGDLLTSIKSFINEQRNLTNDTLKDEREKRFENYLKSFIPDIEHKINQVMNLDINVLRLDLTKNDKEKLVEFPTYEYFQNYLIDHKSDNLCAIVNLGYD